MRIPRDRFEDCFARYYSLVHAIALRLTRSESDADDIAQSVFYKLWTEPPSEVLRVRNWLAAVARNTAIDRLRKRLQETAFWATYNSGAGEAHSAEQEAMDAFDCKSVSSALSKMRDDLRDLIVDSFIECKSHTTIAIERAIPLGTVKTRIRAALTHLRLEMVS
jgi:RNA polymerase sigma factor (sigma-70 family)